MAYTIKPADQYRALEIYHGVVAAITPSPFSAEVIMAPGVGLYIAKVRLRIGKPYCGQHPGECLLNRPRRSLRFLEWNDWVEFHGIINGVLDRLGMKADVWTTPPEPLDQGRKMYIRRMDRGARKSWDWETRGNLRVWNHGSPDQF